MHGGKALKHAHSRDTAGTVPFNLSTLSVSFTTLIPNYRTLTTRGNFTDAKEYLKIVSLNDC